MSSLVKSYLFRVYFLATIAIGMGVSLALLVYNANEKQQQHAIELVDNRIPVLSSINQLIADLSEQERIVYEYYRSQDSKAFTAEFNKNKQVFAMHSADIARQAAFKKQTDYILLQQENIVALADRFHDEMLSNDIDWDYLRELLTNISHIRMGLLPTLYEIEQVTKRAVDESHTNTLNQMHQTRITLIAYGIGIVFFAGVIFFYIQRYVRANAKNTRLALFSQRNPHPILSVNNLGDIVFSNPACKKLLREVGLQKNDIDKLLPPNFAALRQQLSSEGKTSEIIEQPLKERILEINVYWLQEVDAYDLHINDITQRKLAEQSVKNLAFYAQETHLPNLYKLNHDIEEKIAEVSSFTLGFFEIKEFNQLVSALGGGTVAELVNAMVKIIQETVPNGVKLYQINEQQFALLTAKTLRASASLGLTQEILAQAEKPIMAAGGEFYIELDFGYCNYPEHGADLNTIYKNAHTALAKAIADEHAKYILFKDEFAQAIAESASLVDKLRQAINQDELYLVFQPQLELKTHQITGVETLVRWRHKGEFISPGDFIPLSEQSGLIVPIGQWILINACELAKKLVMLGYKDIVVAVNVSPRQFSHPSFYQNVVQALEQTNLPAHNLELEITEGVVMHNEENTLSVLHQLKALGVQLSIDDFGTGYSSLSYLKRFPVDKLKIDQSFVFGCHENHEDRAIINTIVSLGKNLGLSLIAEGVEEEAHVEFLSGLGCHEIQGYWYSKPLEEQDLINFLDSESTSRALTMG